MHTQNPHDLPPGSRPAAPAPSISEHLITAAFFLSGAAGLMLEVIWGRLLHRAFGANAPAVSTVLAVYMGGLALGAWAVKRWPRLRRRPWHNYATLEIGIAACALVLPAAIEAMAPVHRWLAGPLAEHGLQLGVFVVRALCLGCLLLVPTAAMGATLPLLAEGAADRGPVRRVGMLYAVNLIGAVAGAAGVGFAVIPLLGVSAANRIAVLLDLVAALLALLAVRQLPAGAREISRPVEPSGGPLPRHVSWALLALALGGALAMQLQVLWSRALSVVIGSSTYSFSLILAVTLAGMAVGGRLVAGRGGVGGVRGAWRRLAWLLLAAAVAIAVGAQVVDRLPLIVRDAARLPRLSPATLLFIEMGVVAAVVLAPAVALGGVLPCALQITRRQVERRAGAFVGHAYAVNTVGAIVGSLLGGFVVLPMLGVDRGLLLTGACYGAMAASAWWLSAPQHRGRLMRRAAAPAAIALGAAAIAVAPGFDVQRWNAGYFRISVQDEQDDSPGGRLIYHADGVTCTVTVDDEDGSLALKVNGKVDASSMGDMPTQVLSGLLPLFLHDAPRRAAMIGFGSGVTLGSLLTADLERVDAIELEPAVVDAGQLFSHVNEQPWLDPRAHLIYDDGRNVLEGGDVTYDVIVSEPSNPWMSGASSLFTQEFWQIARARLQPDGVFLQWVQLYELGAPRIRSLVRTFSSAFEHVMMLSPNPGSSDSFLVGSPRPLALRMDRVRAAFADPRARRFLDRAGVKDPIDVVGLILLDDVAVRRLGAGAPLNTDDNAYVEFHAPLDLVAYADSDAALPDLRSLFEDKRDQLSRLVRGGLIPEDDGCRGGLSAAWANLRLGYVGSAIESAHRIGLACAGDPEVALSVSRLQEVAAVLLQLDAEPVVDAEAVRDGDLRYLRAVQEMMRGHPEIALTDLDSLVDLDVAPPGWILLYAYLCYRTERLSDAAYLWDRLLTQRGYVHKMPQVYYYAARTAYLRGRHREAARLATYFVEARAVRDGRAVAPGG